jgi:hypothetical protein
LFFDLQNTAGSDSPFKLPNGEYGPRITRVASGATALDWILGGFEAIFSADLFTA